MLSKSLYHTNNAREAIEPLRRALILDPDHTESWFQLALVYAKLNDQAERDKALARVVALSPDRAADLNELGAVAHSTADCPNAAAVGC